MLIKGLSQQIGKVATISQQENDSSNLTAP